MTYPGLSQLDHVADTLVLLLLPGEAGQGGREVGHLQGVHVVQDPVGRELGLVVAPDIVIQHLQLGLALNTSNYIGGRAKAGGFVSPD